MIDFIIEKGEKKEFEKNSKRADRLQTEKAALRQGLEDLFTETHDFYSNERDISLSFWTVYTS